MPTPHDYLQRETQGWRLGPRCVGCKRRIPWSAERPDEGGRELNAGQVYEITCPHCRTKAAYPMEQMEYFRQAESDPNAN